MKPWTGPYIPGFYYLTFKLTLFLIAAGEKSAFKIDSEDDPSVTRDPSVRRDILLDDKTPDIADFRSRLTSVLREF